MHILVYVRKIYFMFISLALHRLIVLFFILFLSVAVAKESIQTKEFDCVLVPSNVADLGSNVRGVISRIHVDRNDFVERGDVIAVLDDKVEQATVKFAFKKASILSEIELSKINLSYAVREEKRAKKAYNNKALSMHDYDVAKVETQLATIKLLQAEEKQILAQNELNLSKAKLAHRTIQAPFSGVITERFKAIGEYIDDDAVIRLAQLDPLHVEVIVPIVERGEIKVGMQAKVCSDFRNANGGWMTKVSQVDEVIDAASGTFGVRLILANPDHEIPAGLRCDLKFVTPVTDMPIEERSANKE